MKKLLQTLFILLLIPKTNAQAPVVFCPPGAEWHFSFFTNFPYANTNEEVKYIYDSVINSANVKILKHRRLFFYQNPSIGTFLTAIKQNGDTVFFRNISTQHSWQILYNFAALAGQSWTTAITSLSSISPYTTTFTITVDSIKNILINNFNLRRLYVKYTPTPFSSYPIIDIEITERFGSSSYLFDYFIPPAYTDGDLASPLCYEDNTFGLKQFTNRACDYEYSVNLPRNSIDDINIHIHPNPSNGLYYFHSPGLNEQSELKVSVSDLSGRIVKELLLDSQEKQPIDLRELSNGVYLITISRQKEILYRSKLIKE